MSERQQTRLPLAAPWPGGHLAADPARASEERLRVDRATGETSLIEQAMRSVFPIQDFSETAELMFVSYELSPPRLSPAECRRSGATHAEPLRITLRLVAYDPGPDGERTIRDVKEQEILLCELPRLTPEGTFVIVGVERVVVRQIAESPGLRFLAGPAERLQAVITPRRGPRLTFEHDRKGLLWARLGASKKKLPATTLLRALGLATGEILGGLHDVETVDIGPGGELSLRIDPAVLLGQRVTRDIKVGGEILVKRHRKVTRVVLRKLELAGVTRLPLGVDDVLGRVLAADVVDPRSGEVLGEASDSLGDSMLRRFAERGMATFTLAVCDGVRAGSTIVDTLRADPNRTTDDALMAIYRVMHAGDPPTLETAESLFANLFFNPDRYDLWPAGRASLDRKLDQGEAGLHELMCLSRQDILGTVRELVRRQFRGAGADDIDHTDEAVVNDAAVLTIDAMHRGLIRLERAVKERMSMVQEIDTLMPSDLISGKTVQGAIDDFFGWSRVSERVDLTHPLAELTQRRRLTPSEPDADSARRSA
ncbi:MAG: hypothetical protein EOO75_03320 [Myxococcales bacterium]|nr:MAG: hypothetical protein EOO75_03320 [Myxococcales bacterium]